MSAERILLAATLLASIVMTSPAWAWTERDVATGAEPARLHGTLTLPAGAALASGVLILAGSGPVDRNGNLPGLPNDSLKLLAHALADRGIVSLRVDKRGIGASQAAGPREMDLRVSTYVDDALSWVDVLRAEPLVSRIFLLGHSEGALVATLAAQRTKTAGLILIAGAGEPAGKVIERQLAAAKVPMSLQDASRRIVTALEAGQTVADVPPELAPLFRPSVQPYLSSWLPLDPAAELARVQAPVLIVQGTTDLQVTVADARRLAGAQPEAELVFVEGMNHVLKTASSERAANLAAYADPNLPLSPDLASSVEAFLNR